MRIDANLGAEMRSLKIDYLEDVDTLSATCVFRWRVGPDEAKSVLGDAFHQLAFGPMRIDADGDAEFDYSELKPSFDTEAHVLKICKSAAVAVTPQVYRIVPSKKRLAVVVVYMRLSILLDGDDLLTKLAHSVGHEVDLHLQVSQPQLPLAGKTA